MTGKVFVDSNLWVESAITPSTVVRASEISEAWKLAYWDGMIFAAAEQDSVEQFLSGDLNHGQAP